jgi:glucose/arabinose dehydrogenase
VGVETWRNVAMVVLSVWLSCGCWEAKVMKHKRWMAVAVLMMLVAAACSATDEGSPTTGAEPGDQTETSGAPSATLPGDTAAPGDTSAPGGTPTVPTPPSAEGLDPLLGLDIEFINDDIPQPSMILSAPGDDFLYMVDKRGTIRVYDTALNKLPDRMINIRDQVASGGVEQGLLGMAFHPDYASNGRFYLYYVDIGGARTLAEFTVQSNDPPITDPASQRILWTRDQPENVEPRHYGGFLEFGPDGYLYVSVGDGARASVNGQDPNNFFGTILRLDVDGGDPYGIPPDNPFVDGGGAPEVWAYGLRNPWRFDIDPVDNLIYIADVGQVTWEEVDVLSLDGGGYNLGWDQVEGISCFRDGCDMSLYVPPAVVYGREDGCSITGGVVYRGSAIPELYGDYFYADWCTGMVRSFKFVNGEVTEEQDWSDGFGAGIQINTWGTDSDGEMWIGTFDGSIYKIVPRR